MEAQRWNSHKQKNEIKIISYFVYKEYQKKQRTHSDRGKPLKGVQISHKESVSSQFQSQMS